LTVHTWKKSYYSWLNDEWESLDAIELENIVDNSNKSLSTVIRFFREKDFPGILKIAETIKSGVEVFKPFVPLALALRKEGMKDRHWEYISNKV
jgi:dynein heavy chain